MGKLDKSIDKLLIERLPETEGISGCNLRKAERRQFTIARFVQPSFADCNPFARASGYVGINNHMGSRFTTDRARMNAVMDEMESLL